MKFYTYAAMACLVAGLSAQGIAVGQCSADLPLVVGPADQYAFQWCNGSSATSIGLLFASSANEYQFKKTTGANLMTLNPTAAGYIRMGSPDAGNYTYIDADGDLLFSGTADILVRNNSYAFRAQADEDNGLFFNVADNQYEFRANDANAGFTIKANSAGGATNGDFASLGSGSVAADLTVGDDLTVNGIEIGRGNGNVISNVVVAAQGALASNTTGADNVVVGFDALQDNVDGFQNVAIGSGSSRGNVDGYYNIGVGSRTLQNNESGIYNVAIGAWAMSGVANAPNFNTSIGAFSMDGINSATFSTAYGYDAGRSIDVENNATALGYGAAPTASNTIHVGNTSVTSIRGQVGFSTFSDARFKNDVRQDEVVGLEFITRLRPVTYAYSVDKVNAWIAQGQGFEQREGSWPEKYDIEEIRFSGFLAQEVEATAEEVGYAFSGVDAPKNDNDFYSIRYAEFVVPLVKAVQEQQDIIQDMQEAIIQQDERTKVLEAALAQLLLQQTQDPASGPKLPASSVPTGLGQNVPNPFDGSTLIPYSVPQDASDAMIVITGPQGNQVDRLPVTEFGTGHVTFQNSNLAQGWYVYSLFVNGTVVDSKTMVVR